MADMDSTGSPVSEPQEQSDTTALYRHYSADGDLLYVGVSLNAVARLAQHRVASNWFAEIARVSIEYLPTRAEALAAETAAIKAEKPRHNIQKVSISIPEPEVERLVTPTPESEQKSRLTVRLTNASPLNSLYEAARALDTSTESAAYLIDRRRLGHVISLGSSGYDEIYVTGWQLLSYVESLSNGDTIPRPSDRQSKDGVFSRSLRARIKIIEEYFSGKSRCGIGVAAYLLDGSYGQVRHLLSRAGKWRGLNAIVVNGEVFLDALQVKEAAIKHHIDRRWIYYGERRLQTFKKSIAQAELLANPRVEQAAQTEPAE